MIIYEIRNSFIDRSFDRRLWFNRGEQQKLRRIGEYRFQQHYDSV